MSVLINHNREQIDTVFQLLGDKENDITKAIAWVMNRCPILLQNFINTVFGHSINNNDPVILYQQFEKTGSENGYTDLEITDEENIHIIIEAKRGWILPGSTQLTKYAHRPSFINSKAKNKIIVSLSECSQSYADLYLAIKCTDNDIPVVHFSWEKMYSLAQQSIRLSNNEQKHILNEFMTYLKGIMTMQNNHSNQVYVVSLSKETIGNTSLIWTDIVEKTSHYFCPMGKYGWPKVAPNYIAFRYSGKLQSIHHIEGYTITKNMHDVIDIMPDENWEDDHFIFDLGPAIVPSKEVRTGKGIYRNGRVWVALDLLLTCNTITEAKDKTKARE